MKGDLAASDLRVSEPLYTMAEAAMFLGQRPGTFREWVQGAGTSRSLVHHMKSDARGEPTIPFIGLAEGAVASILRGRHLSMQYIRKALTRLQEEIGVEYALASKNLYLHGAAILFDYLQQDDQTLRLVEVVSGNAVFRPVVRDQLERISYDDLGFADRIILPSTKGKVVAVDPVRASGQPVTIRGGARVVDLLARFRGGEKPDFIAKDFEVPETDVLEIIRAFYTAA